MPNFQINATEPRSGSQKCNKSQKRMRNWPSFAGLLPTERVGRARHSVHCDFYVRVHEKERKVYDRAKRYMANSIPREPIGQHRHSANAAHVVFATEAQISYIPADQGRGRLDLHCRLHRGGVDGSSEMEA